MSQKYKWGFPLAGLFLLVAGCSIFMAMARSILAAIPVHAKWADVEWLVVAAGAGAVVGFVVGVFSADTDEWHRGIVLRLIGGPLLGALAGAQLAAPVNMPVMLAGSGAVLAFAVLIHLTSRRPAQ